MRHRRRSRDTRSNEFKSSDLGRSILGSVLGSPLVSIRDIDQVDRARLIVTRQFVVRDAESTAYGRACTCFRACRGNRWQSSGPHVEQYRTHVRRRQLEPCEGASNDAGRSDKKLYGLSG
jgi:hypothetical protein